MFVLNRLDLLLHWSRAFFVTTGVLLLCYGGFELLDARLYQAEQTRQFDDELNRPVSSTAGSEQMQPSTLSKYRSGSEAARGKSPAVVVRKGAPLGRIEIGAVGLAAMIMEGVDDGTLRRAVGHIPGAPLPGQQGNVALAGHRDTFFRGLRKIKVNDEINLTTLAGSYRYRVDATKVVKPEETDVLKDSNEDVLTLVTCYPFDYIGSAPMRFIVRASRVLE